MLTRAQYSYRTKIAVEARRGDDELVPLERIEVDVHFFAAAWFKTVSSQARFFLRFSKKKSFIFTRNCSFTFSIWRAWVLFRHLNTSVKWQNARRSLPHYGAL